MEERHVTIGDQEYRIAAFSPRKVLIAGQMLKSIAGTAGEIMTRIAEFRNEYRERNREVVTRHMAALPPWNSLLDYMDADAWERCGGQVELRRDPSEQEIAIEVFPQAFDLAEDEVIRLLALVIIPNQELGAATLESRQLEALDEYGRQIVDGGTLGEMIDLLDVAATVIREEIGAKADPMGRLRALWSQWTNRGQPTTSPDQPEGSSERKPDSSTSSPAPTDGDTPTSSTASPGAPQSAATG